MLNGILTWIAIGVVLFYGGAQVVQLDWSVDLSPWSASVHLDPVFLVWDETNSIPGSGCSIGPVIILEERWRGTDREAYVMHHELNHVRQWYALGWTFYPAKWFDVLPIEAEFPAGHVHDWTHPEENDELMWLPENGPSLGHFLTLELRLGS